MSTLLALLLLMGIGCSSTGELIVSVSDGSTLAPVPGAVVSASSMKFFVPVYPYPQLSPFPVETSDGVTDDQGRVRLAATKDSPMRVSVQSPGHTRFVGVLEYAGLDDAGLERWILSGSSRPTEADDPLLIVEVVEPQATNDESG